MSDTSLKQLLDTFVDFLSTEKGYSDNTCRAYSNDLEDFIAYFLSNRALAITYEDDDDEKDIDVLASWDLWKISCLELWFQSVAKHGDCPKDNTLSDYV